jgi:hypothetical protein
MTPYAVGTFWLLAWTTAARDAWLFDWRAYATITGRLGNQANGCCRFARRRWSCAGDFSMMTQQPTMAPEPASVRHEADD